MERHVKEEEKESNKVIVFNNLNIGDIFTRQKYCNLHRRKKVSVPKHNYSQNVKSNFDPMESEKSRPPLTPPPSNTQLAPVQVG